MYLTTDVSYRRSTLDDSDSYYGYNAPCESNPGHGVWHVCICCLHLFDILFLYSIGLYSDFHIHTLDICDQKNVSVCDVVGR